MARYSFTRQEEKDWGDALTTRLVDAVSRLGTFRMSPRIYTDRVIQRLDPEVFALDRSQIDRRLVVVGFDRMTPDQWARDFPRFFRYWYAAAPRPDRVGSSYNPPVDFAYAAWKKGIPARAVKTGAVPPEVPSRKLTPAKVAQYRDATRAAARTSACCSFSHCGLTFGSLRRLGRVSPEAQRIVLKASGYQECNHRHRGMRPADLNWEAAAKQVRALRSPRVRLLAAYADKGRSSLHIDAETQDDTPERHLVPRRFSQLLVDLGLAEQDVVDIAPLLGSIGTTASTLAPMLTPAYPRLRRFKTMIAVAQGESPSKVSGGMLDRKEAHAWLSEGAAVEPLDYLKQPLPPEAQPVQLPAVVRWLRDVQTRGQWGQLLQSRTVHGPEGRVFEYKYADRLAAVEEDDLPRGVRTRVEDAFTNAARRFGQAWEQENIRNFERLAPKPSWTPPAGVRVLQTPADLICEGQTMDHCVSSYVEAVRGGRVHILSLAAPHPLSGEVQRSTAEVDAKTGTVHQHRGPRNVDPAPHLGQLLAQTLTLGFAPRRGS